MSNGFLTGLLVVYLVGCCFCQFPCLLICLDFYLIVWCFECCTFVSLFDWLGVGWLNAWMDRRNRRTDKCPHDNWKITLPTFVFAFWYLLRAPYKVFEKQPQQATITTLLSSPVPSFSSKHALPFPETDECKSNNGGCEQICEDTLGGYRCSCHPGYELRSNNKNCEGECVKPQSSAPYLRKISDFV